MPVRVNGHIFQLLFWCVDMPELMKSKIITICLCQLLQATPNPLIRLRNNEILVTLMRYCVNQLLNISRNNKSSCGIVGLVQLADNIFSLDKQLTALNCQNSIFNVTEQQTTHLAHSQTEPHRQNAWQLDLRAANHANHLICGRQCFHVRLLWRKRHNEIRTNAVHFQCCYNQILSLGNRFAAFGRGFLVNCTLHRHTVHFVNVHLHQQRQPVFQCSFVEMDG